MKLICFVYTEILLEGTSNKGSKTKLDGLSEITLKRPNLVQSQLEGGEVQVGVVSDEEVQELQRTLGDLKSLSLSVGEELSVQNEKIDILSSDVENANVRVTHTDKKVKKML